MKRALLALFCVLLLTVTAVACTVSPVTEPPVTTESVTTAPETLPATTEEPTSEPVTAPTESTTAPTTTTAVTTVKTTAKTTASWKKDYKALQLIRDPSFRDGFIINGSTPTAVTGNWQYYSTKNEPVWGVNNPNWASYRDRNRFLNLLTDNISKAKNALRNTLCGLTYNEKENSLTCHWDSYDWYNGEGHDAADTWPAMILGTGFYNTLQDFRNEEDDVMAHYSCGSDKMIFSLDVRMTTYAHEFYAGVNDCQFILFFYLHSSRGSGDGFVWFGLPLFDDNFANATAYYKETPEFFVDSGSNCFIYDVPPYFIYQATDPDGRQDFYDADLTKPEASDEWMHLEIDLKPWLDKLAAMTIKDTEYNIFRQAKSVDDLYISGMNIGYEVHGSYKVDFEIKNMALTSYIKK